MLASDSPPPADAEEPVSALAIAVVSMAPMAEVEVSDPVPAVSEPALPLHPALSNNAIAAAAVTALGVARLRMISSKLLFALSRLRQIPIRSPTRRQQ